eukprot:6192745-Pleurochrysis_carterae.AAC.1
MSSAAEGLSPLWQLGKGPMPALLAAFGDGEPFYPHEWDALRAFFAEFAPPQHQVQSRKGPAAAACRPLTFGLASTNVLSAAARCLAATLSLNMLTFEFLACAQYLRIGTI